MQAAPPDTDARALLRAEGPRAALERLKLEVRKAPRDARLRTFLFQLFCVFAEWDRALNQLTVANELTGVDPANPLALPMAQMAEAYRAAIRCEMLRERVFSGTRTPTILGQPEPWMPQLIEANRVLATAGADAAARRRAAELRDAAFEAAPAAAGFLTLGGPAPPSPTNDGETAATGAKKTSAEPKPFAWIADADQRLGPMLEAFIEGKYYWLPFTRLARLDIEAPADLRDHVWMPAHFTWANGGEAHGFIPTRYPGSAAAASSEAGEALAWSRRTEWRPAGADGDDDWFLGLGQRMLATDADEVALMDLRRIVVSAPAPEVPEASVPEAGAEKSAEDVSHPA
jgi:type VI secretion system protein ImpE